MDHTGEVELAIEAKTPSGRRATGRRLSRAAVRKQVEGSSLRRRPEDAGIAVRVASLRSLAEEAPEAYEDIERVVQVVERAGHAGRVARPRPIGVVKG